MSQRPSGDNSHGSRPTKRLAYRSIGKLPNLANTVTKRPALPYPAQALRDREHLNTSPKDTKAKLLDRLSQEYHDLQYKLDLMEARLNAVSTWQPESNAPCTKSEQKPDLLALTSAHAYIGQLRWPSNLALKYNNLGDSAGNISGVAWCNGVFLSGGYFLTTGHCFDEGGGWQLPNRYGVVSSPETIAPLFEICTSAMDGTNDNRLQIEELAYHRPLGLDCAIVRLSQQLSQHNDSSPESFNALELERSLEGEHVSDLINEGAFLVDYQDSQSEQESMQSNFHSVKITQHQRSIISFISLPSENTLSGTPLMTHDGRILGIKLSGSEAVDIRAIAQILVPVLQGQVQA